MPFLVRCRRCNHLMLADDGEEKELVIEIHGATSHNGRVTEGDFIVSRISRVELKALRFAMSSKSFWRTYNKSRKL